jgi:predicted RNase H-like HicB family nuclease/predicted RNA binding protein YcfA (HicA-like mRNA interferase family)
MTTHVAHRDIIHEIEADGWKAVRVTGAHHHFRHDARPGVVTVSQPGRDPAAPTAKPGPTRHYVGLIHKDPDSDFGISFPDFPGCVSAGASLDETVALGREALQGHVELMAEAGETIPEPTAMEAILADPANRDGAPVLVPLSPTAPRTVRVNVTMPEDTLRAIDAHAEQHGYTRSGFLVAAARRAMDGA